MGVDHEADPGAPDPASRDHEDSSAFDVWATRDHKDGPAVPVETSYAPADGPLFPVQARGDDEQAPHDEEDGPAFPSDASGGQEAAPELPARIPADQEAAAALPTKAPSNPEGAPPLPARIPRDQEAPPALPTRTPPGHEDVPALPTRSPDDHDGAPALPTRTPGNHEGTALPTRTPGNHEGAALPFRASGNREGAALPTRNPGAPGSATALPGRTPPGRDGSPALPTRTPGNQGGGSALPTRAPRGAEGGTALPVRGSSTPGDGSVLPVRTTRYRRSGRHSSPHQLSLPSDTPALVIAVPGSARPESEEIVIRVAEMAGSSCHGAEVRVGYLRGSRDSLEEVLDELGPRPAGPAAVVVPLLAFPNAEADAAIADVVAMSRTPLLTAAHLGPHPLLAEALHARLADAGLARAARVGRISIVTAADGVIVGTAGEEEAIEGAGVVAVLLASRLTMPVAAASLTDPASIKDAANRLREARVTRVALAPCMIGPELTSGTLDAIAALTSTDCAPPLGSHSAVGKLVAIRYGAALADPQVATMMAEARGEPLPASPLPASVPPSAPAT
jgi:sirohydrochlorin ferrochelatase